MLSFDLASLLIQVDVAVVCAAALLVLALSWTIILAFRESSRRRAFEELLLKSNTVTVTAKKGTGMAVFTSYARYAELKRGVIPTIVRAGRKLLAMTLILLFRHWRSLLGLLNSQNVGYFELGFFLPRRFREEVYEEYKEELKEKFLRELAGSKGVKRALLTLKWIVIEIFLVGLCFFQGCYGELASGVRKLASAVWSKI